MSEEGFNRKCGNDFFLKMDDACMQDLV